MLLQNRVRLISGIISTDDILPARYKHTFVDPEQLAPHIFENIYPHLASTIKKYDVLVCDNIFGIGSSREQAVSTLLTAGITGVLAPSFGGIFFRNAWNLGLLAIEIHNFEAREGNIITIDLEKGLINRNLEFFSFTAVPVELIEMAKAGGLLAWLKRREQ